MSKYPDTCRIHEGTPVQIQSLPPLPFLWTDGARVSYPGQSGSQRLA